MDRSDVERWIADYRKAWASDDPAEIAALFTEDVTYSPFPWPRDTDGWAGRDTVVSKWIERGDSKVGWRFDHEIVAVEGDTAVIQGTTHYDAQGDDPATAFSNIFVVRFADDGRARRFAEWWVEKPRD